VVKIVIFGLKHRITRKLLKMDRYILRGVWQALNCLSIHATYCMIVAGASPGETKMWAAVVKTAIFSRSWIMSKRINMCSIFFSPSGSHTVLVYRSYTDTTHRAASLRQRSFLLYRPLVLVNVYECKCVPQGHRHTGAPSTELTRQRLQHPNEEKWAEN